MLEIAAEGNTLTNIIRPTQGTGCDAAQPGAIPAIPMLDKLISKEGENAQ